MSPEQVGGGTLDLDATEKDESRTITVGKTTYVVRAHLDIPMEELDEARTAHDTMTGKPWHEQLRLARRVVQILVPTLPDGAINKMTGRQIIRLMANLMGLEPAEAVKTVPPNGGPAPAE